VKFRQSAVQDTIGVEYLTMAQKMNCYSGHETKFLKVSEEQVNHDPAGLCGRA